MSVLKDKYSPQEDLKLVKEHLAQCAPCADILLDNFRDDDNCRILNEFLDHGVSFCELIKLQQKIPIIYPWNVEYDHLRQNVNRRFTRYPFAIVMAETKEHVIKAIKFSRKHKIPVRARSGSHCFEAFSLTDNGIVIDQSRRKGIKINDKEKTVVLEPGFLIGPTQLALSKHNLALASGTCPNTGSGIVLGGGVGFLERKFGLTSDNLIEAEIILADGTCIRTNEQKHNDLFFALRGAGNGNFGIVTEYTLKVHKIKNVTIFDLTFPYSQIKEVIDKWQRWAPFTVDELTSELDIYSDHVLVTGLYLGDAKPLKALLKPMLRLNPETVTVEELRFIDSVRHFAGNDVWFPFFKNKSSFAKEFLPMEAIEVIEKYMKCGGPQDHVEFDAFGGYLCEVSPTATAFPHRDALFWVLLQMHTIHQYELPERIAWVTAFYEELKPYLIGAYVNAPDIDIKCPLDQYYGVNLPRLIKIKTKYDPSNYFRYPQSIPVEKDLQKKHIQRLNDSDAISHLE